VTARDFTICLFFTSSTSATAVPHQCCRVGEEGEKEEGGMEGRSKRVRGRKREGEEEGREIRKRGRY
jgi:hypothetical protein